MKKEFLRMLLPLAGVVALAGCRPQGSDAGHYIKLSDVVLTFAAEDEEVKSVTVRSNPDWSFTGDASWVEVSREGNTLEISVKPNADAERSAKIGLTAGEATAEIEVRQLAKEGPDARYRLLDKLANAAMSPSGRYVGGFYRDVLGENEWQYTAVIIDLDTDEWLEFGPYPETLLGLSETEVMTDQGVLYISDTTNGGCVAFDLEGNYFVPGSAPGYGSLVLQGVSADGSVMVGYTEGAPGGVMYGAVKVVDGEVRPLELPDTNFRGEEWWAGVLVRGISADGSVMYGTSWENYDYGMVYWDKEGNVDWVGSDLRTMTTVQRPDHLTGDTYPYNIVNGMMCGANQMQISPDGKWIAGNFRKERYDGESDEVLSTSCPAFFNTETKKTVLFEEYDGCTAMGVTADGLGLVGVMGMGVTDGFFVDLETQTKVADMRPWIQDRFGIALTQGAIHYVAPDGRKVLGITLRAEPYGGVTALYWYVAPAL